MLPSGRAFKHGGMCLLVAQTMASELLLGGGEHEDYLSRLTFSLKKNIFLFVPLHSVTQYLSSSDGVLVSFIFPSIAAAVVVVVFIGFFSPVKRALSLSKKKRSLLSATQSRGDLSLCVNFTGPSSGADKQGLFAVNVDRYQ